MALTLLAPTFVNWNGFDLPNVKDRPKITRTAKLRSATPSGFPGDYSQGGLSSAKHVTVSGKIVLPGGQTLDDALSQFHAALPIALSGNTAAEWLGQPARALSIRKDAARLYRAEVESVAEQDSAEYSFLDYDVVFYVPDGLEYSAAQFTAAFSSGAVTATSSGSYRAAPTYSISVTTAGGSIALSNAATGQVLTISPDGDRRHHSEHQDPDDHPCGSRHPGRSPGADGRTEAGGERPQADCRERRGPGRFSLAWRDRWE